MRERRRSPTERPRARVRSDETEDRLRAWIRSVDPEAEISLRPPGEARAGRGVSVYLLDIAPQPPARGAGRPPLQLSLRYLVTTWAEDPAAADRLLVDLAYSAMEQTDLEVDLEALPPVTWTALQAVARPSFVLRVTVRRSRARPPAPPVLLPLRLRSAQPALVAGVVRGPGGVPLADAAVAIPGIGREARTDRQGRFQLAGVPGPPLSTHLVVRAKGTETSVKLPKDPARARALVIEINSLEGTNA